ncbi:hypothetical protein D3C71_1625520 [compost metagenome]
MVVHQHISMHRHSRFLRVFKPQRMQHLKIFVIDEDGLPVVATLNHMVGVARQSQARESCHGGFITKGVVIINRPQLFEDASRARPLSRGNARLAKAKNPPATP